MPTLTIQLPGLPPVSHVLKDETTTIGRMKGNTIVIEDSSISLMHAKITRKDGEFYLKDLNSTNGTIINGQAIAEAKLRDLDRVRFAEIPAQFQADAVPVGVVAQAVPALAPQPIQAVNPLRAISSEAPNPLPRLNAPAPAIPAAVTPVPPPAPPRGERSPGAAWGMFTQFVPMVSGAAALAVLCVFGWRFLQVQQNDRVRSLVQEAAAVGPIQGHLAERRDLPIAKAAPEKVNPPRASRSAVAQNSAQPARVENLVRELKSEDVTDRRRASAALHNLGAEAKPASTALKDALQDTDSEVQMWAALTLVDNQSYDKRAIPVLVRVLQHDNPVLRQVACLSLGLMSYEEAEKQTVIPALAETAGKDSDEEVRQAAKSALGIIAPELVSSGVAN